MSNRKKIKYGLGQVLGRKMSKLSATKYVYQDVLIHLNTEKYDIYRTDLDKLVFSGEYGGEMMTKIREILGSEGVRLP